MYFIIVYVPHYRGQVILDPCVDINSTLLEVGITDSLSDQLTAMCWRHIYWVKTEGHFHALAQKLYCLYLSNPQRIHWCAVANDWGLPYIDSRSDFVQCQLQILIYPLKSLVVSCLYTFYLQMRSQCHNLINYSWNCYRMEIEVRWNCFLLTQTNFQTLKVAVLRQKEVPMLACLPPLHHNPFAGSLL